MVPIPMKDNRGFTLIELIIVMLIMAILAVGGVAGYNLLYVGNSKHAAERITSILSSVQMDNMTKSKVYTMEIKQDAATGDYILSVYYEVTPGNRRNDLTETLDLKDGRITFENDAGDLVTVTSTDFLLVSFRKDTGGVKAYNIDGDVVTRIGITSSLGSTCYIRLVKATGKHYIE